MMNIPFRIVFFSLIAVFAPCVRAAAGIGNVRFSNIDVSNGLPHNGVYSVLHDSRGFIWIGTREGLCRYDGYEMRRYDHDPSNPFTPPYGIVTTMMEDSRGRLWTGSDGGPALYDRDMDRFDRISSYEGDPDNPTLSFLEAGGTIYVSTMKGLMMFDEENNRYLPVKQPSVTLLINEMAEDRNGVLWLASDQGVWLFDPSRSGSVARFDYPVAESAHDANVRALTCDERGRIWFGVTGRVGIYDPADGSYREYSPADGLGAGIIRAIEFDSEGNAWVGGEDGLDIISPRGEVRHIAQGISDVTGISDNAIYTIHRDRNDNMWVGSYFGGVDVMKHSTSVFSSYSYGFSDRHLSGKAVRQMIADGDHALWIATEDGGLNRFDRCTGRFTHYQVAGNEGEGGIKINYHNVHSLLEDRHGVLWIGTFTGGLNRYDPHYGLMTYPPIMKNGVEVTMVFALLEDDHGDIWIGTTEGLFFKRADSEEIEPVECRELSDTFVYAMAFDTEGRLWASTMHGELFRYDKRSGVATRMLESDREIGFVTTIITDSSGDVWAGTSGGGVICFDRGHGNRICYTTEDGLPSNSIMGIVRDNGGDLWISTDRGLCRFSQDQSRIRTYTTGDGLPTNLFNYCSAFKASDGELFFGTIDGMVSFHPDRIDIPRPALRVEFTDFQTGDRRVAPGGTNSPLEKDITQTYSVRLTSRQASSVSFGFTALNFSHAADIHYAIRMGKTSPEWQYAGKEHRVLFSRLRHGRYTLSVKASYDGIEWDEEGMRSIDIHIMPPFLLSGWAMMIYALLAVGAAAGAWFFARSRMRFLRLMDREEEARLQAEEMSRQKTVFFGNISHDLKTPLSLILGPLQRMTADRGVDPDTRNTLSVALRNTQRMKNLLEELVMMSKIEMSHLEVTVQQGNVLEFIDRMCDIFRVFSGETGINFFTAVDHREGRRVWFSPTNMERIVYNLLSNAFKFTPAGGTISIRAWLGEGADDRSKLYIQVGDTGQGIDPAEQEKIFENYYTTAGSGRHKGAGIGLALTRSLVKLHKGEISVESSPGEGAVFNVTINVDRNAYDEGQISPVPVETGNKAAHEYIDGNSGYLRQARIEIQNRIPQRSRVLVVEDNRELNEFVVKIFSGDFDVLAAYDGAQGFEMATREVPDIIISDIVMPEMNGLEMTRRLKSELMTSHIPVVLLTARSEENEKIEGFEFGADAYIEKPFNTQRLELQIHNLLNTRHRNIERFKHDTTFDAQKLTHNPRDEKFLESMVGVIMKNLDNERLAVRDITDALGISRSLLHIKLKNLAGLSVTEFIRNIRMREARERLAQGMNVSEASFAVGISDPNYFTKCFKKQFGQTPSDFIRARKNST